ncbi:MAG: hypothetical protein ACP5NS_04310 [Candidatus Pacearchaeota archaeon]
MPSKRDDYEDESDSESSEDKKGFSVGLTTVIFGILFLILAEAFLYLLSAKTGVLFGVKEIIFGVMLAIVITLFFAWVKYIIGVNKHLGAIIGIVGTGASVYGLTRKFSGPFTTTFAIIGTIIALGYVLIQFLKAKQN